MTTYTYINSPSGDNITVPNVLLANDILQSPSGTFDAVLQGDGNFVTFYGPNPFSVVLWSAGHSYPNSGPWGLLYQEAGPPNIPPRIFAYGPSADNGKTAPYTLISGYLNYNAPSSFLQLNDNGTLSVYPGQNGVASGSALATIRPAAATSSSDSTPARAIWWTCRVMGRARCRTTSPAPRSRTAAPRSRFRTTPASPSPGSPA